MELRPSPWFSDGRNLVMVVLAGAVLLMALLIAIATVSSVSSPSPYERATSAEAARAELRDRINAELANQTIINRDVYTQLDQLKMQVETKSNDRTSKDH